MDAQHRGAVEAILMVAASPIPADQLAQVLDVDAREMEETLRDLAREYAEARGGIGHGFELREAGGGWRFYSSRAYADTVGRFIVGAREAHLSQAALETLAVVAYRQPVSRAQISAIRGVSVDGVVRTLLARGLIEEVGEGHGGAHLYGTSADFLEKMGMRSLDELVPLAPYLPDKDFLDELEEEL